MNHIVSSKLVGDLILKKRIAVFRFQTVPLPPDDASDYSRWLKYKAIRFLNYSNSRSKLQFFNSYWHLCFSVYSFVHSSIIFLFGSWGSPVPMSSCLCARGGVTLDRWQIHHRATYRQMRQTTIHTLTHSY